MSFMLKKKQKLNFSYLLDDDDDDDDTREVHRVDSISGRSYASNWYHCLHTTYLRSIFMSFVWLRAPLVISDVKITHFYIFWGQFRKFMSYTYVFYLCLILIFLGFLCLILIFLGFLCLILMDLGSFMSYTYHVLRPSLYHITYSKCWTL